MTGLEGNSSSSVTSRCELGYSNWIRFSWTIISTDFPARASSPLPAVARGTPHGRYEPVQKSYQLESKNPSDPGWAAVDNPVPRKAASLGFRPVLLLCSVPCHRKRIRPEKQRLLIRASQFYA